MGQYSIAAAVEAVLGLVTAGVFGIAGFRMLALESQAGNTVAEAFYQGMGIVSLAMGGLTLLVAFAAAVRTSALDQ